MNFTQTIAAAAIMAAGSTAMAGAVVELAPSQTSGTLTGLDNTMFPEIRGTTLNDAFYDFSILSDVEGVDSNIIFEGTLMTRVVRSNLTGLLTFNYMLTDPNNSLAGAISHIEISGFADMQTRVEYRNDAGAPGDEGPAIASRDASGDIISFDFGGNLETAEESNFFFVMLDTAEYQGDTTATIYLTSGEAVSVNLGNPVPTPGALGLLSAAGLMTVRRRR